ncbi:AAA family ATPase [Halorussus gelatinilyticus]|uniref:AAA family ATPase n=1 Tax=Halorussus gelatinilyticus TaxID=2937524 RepID=A0A8U0IJH3_9EURY|nr:AAA family ATPase [Halorussus gelatinilyticus]UPW01267.1 AAA family ATPase [Halorussus gelatinilyticus]
MAETESLDARQGTPQFVVVCGLPGVGKTTVAEDVAERLDGRLLRTDVVRKDILDDPEYTEGESRMVYRELFERASDVVEGGRSVVLDGTFKDAGDRERAVELAESLDATFRLVKVECDESVVRDRIAAREDDESDADFEVHAMYRERFDAISADHVTVDNSESAAETLRQVAEQF